MKIIKLNEPEFIGKIPVRNEITILYADDCKIKQIGWTCCEYSGAEVYALDLDDNPIYEPLLNKSDLYPGKKILAPTLFGEVKAEVIQNENCEFHATTESGHTHIFLEFSTDDRKCWITTGAANLRGI